MDGIGDGIGDELMEIRVQATQVRGAHAPREALQLLRGP